MIGTHYDSVDAKDLALLYEDEIELNVAGRKRKLEPEPKYSFAERFINFNKPANTTPVDNDDNYRSVTNPYTNYTTQKPVKSREEKGLSGIGDFVSENPLTALLLGAVIAGGAYMAYKYISEPEELVKDRPVRRSGTRVSVRRRSTGGSRRTDTNITINKNITVEPEDTEEDTEDLINDNTEPVSAKELGICAASAIGGGVVGAAIGNASLISSVSLAITGLIFSDWYMASAAIGMGVTGLYRCSNGKEDGILDGLFSGKSDKEPPGTVQTMLGALYPKTT